MIREIPKVLRESGWRITATVALVPGGYRMINVEKGDTTAQATGQQSTLEQRPSWYIRSLIDGSIVVPVPITTVRSACGDDILSGQLCKTGRARETPGTCRQYQCCPHCSIEFGRIDRDDIYEVVVAGNTIMTHILMGIDPAYMIEEPYVPVVRRYLTTSRPKGRACRWQELRLFIFPAVSDFIGGYHRRYPRPGMAEANDISLLIDIGTNFEVVLATGTGCSPAPGLRDRRLKGARCLFGMRANPGAIEQVSLDLRTLKPSFRTIRNQRPRGLCGSGLIDLLAEVAPGVSSIGPDGSTARPERIRQGRQVPRIRHRLEG